MPHIFGHHRLHLNPSPTTPLWGKATQKMSGVSKGVGFCVSKRCGKFLRGWNYLQRVWKLRARARADGIIRRPLLGVGSVLHAAELLY